MADWTVYWLYDDQCVCPWRHGYIGITSKLASRLKNHRRRWKRPFEHKVLFVGAKTECRALEWALRPEASRGWNKNVGGMKSPRLGVVLPAHVKQNMREAANRRWQEQPMTEETRDKYRVRMLGTTNKGRLGQKKSTGERAKIAAAHIGMKAAPGTLQKQSERMIGNRIHLGHRHTEETKQTLRMKKIGVAIHSDEHKNKLAERMKGNAFTKGRPWSGARRMAWLMKKEKPHAD
jgi:hypothetical protein